MLWIDVKYAQMLSGRLEKFKVRNHSPYQANFRCPFCGDSSNNKSRTRGYILEKGSSGFLLYYCHNCGLSTTFDKALKDLDPTLHQEYVLEKLKERSGIDGVVRERQTTVVHSPPVFRKNPLKGLKKISQLSPDHGAKKYVERRMIPHDQHYRLYHCSRFAEWTNTLIPEKFDEEALKYDCPRLVIPFFDSDGNLFGYTGRAYGKESLRYVTIMLDDSKPKVFGLDKVDTSRDAFVLEGPLDALFAPNAIAMAGADLDASRVMPKERAIYVYDNEPRNKEIIRKIENKIDAGYRVVIFPDAIQQKDLNDMVRNGLCLEELSGILHRNTYYGLSATLRLNEWKRI